MLATSLGNLPPGQVFRVNSIHSAPLSSDFTSDSTYGDNLLFSKQCIYSQTNVNISGDG